MNYLLICLLVSFATSTFASQFVFPNMYSKYAIVQGTGVKYEEAKKDAMSGIPKGWEVDPANSPTVGCTKWQKGSVVNVKLDEAYQCNTSISGNKVIYSVSVVPTDDPKERAIYLERIKK